MHAKSCLLFPWLNFVKKILEECGLSYIWISHVFVSDILTIKKFLHYQFQQEWGNTIHENSKKPLTIGFSMKFIVLKSTSTFLMIKIFCFFFFCQFRATNHRLPIEHGRWNNVPRKHRYCTLCNLNQIGDKFHHFTKCPFFNQFRNTYISRNFYQGPNIFNFKYTINPNNKLRLLKLCKFVRIMTKYVELLGQLFCLFMLCIQRKYI